MCIIIEKKAGFTISSEWHKAFWSRNPDGMGAVYWPDGIGRPPKVKRSLSSERAWQHLQAIGDKPAIVHYRMATHGDVTKVMTHPFTIAEGIYFIHNGIMDAPLHSDASYSDTAAFAELVLQPLIASIPQKSQGAFLRSFAFRYLLEQHLGNGNRAVICDKYGWVVFNQQLWHTLPDNGQAGGLGGLRFSNTYAWSNPYALPVAKATKPVNWYLKPEKELPKEPKQSNVELVDYPVNGLTYSLTEAEARQLPYSELVDWVEYNPLDATELLYDLLHDRDLSYF